MPSEGTPLDCLPGRLFVFEGPDGVGKSTLASEVARKLNINGIDTLLLSFPGREPKTLGRIIYSIHHNPDYFEIDHVSPTSLQVLHVAAHIDCIENRIIPALSMGKTVVLDRYWWSTFAYGRASGIPHHVLQAMIVLENTAWRNVRPNKVFLITRQNQIWFELPTEKWSNICNEYMAIAERERERGYYPVEIIDNAIPLDNITDEIFGHIFNGSSRITHKGNCQQEIFKDQTRKASSPKCLKDHWNPTKTTVVFDTYWRFAAERQAVFFKRLKNDIQPWTVDPIIRDFKFTNAYRASDRVSQFLISQVIYNGDQDAKEIIFRILLFKTFNKIETWNLLLKEIGQIVWKEYDFRLYDSILTKALEDKNSIYSAAYIMPSGGRSFGHQAKHRNHLSLIQKMMMDDIHVRVTDAKSLQEVFELLRRYPMIGDFLAYQYTIDINYSPLTNFSEMSFVVPGPGAKDGLRKCFRDFGGLSEVDLIKFMADRQEEEFARLGIQFQNLWGRPLQLIDCQNLFCEVDKYSRIAHPEIKGITGRNRIKQKYKLTPKPLNLFYPLKWNINEKINIFLTENSR